MLGVTLLEEIIDFCDTAAPYGGIIPVICPRQEEWMYSYREKSATCIALGVMCKQAFMFSVTQMCLFHARSWLHRVGCLAQAY